jgi:DNA-binding transcriptional LysR family regulator
LVASRRIPLDSLRAFEAAARHGSFAKAGQELNVTPAAISHRVKHLEMALGVPMFARLPRGVLLTDAGRRYRDSIAEAFRLIERATATVDQVTVEGPLMVSLPESIAQFWLLPRLHRLADYAPGLELTVEADSRLSTLSDGGADIAIRFGSGNYPEFESELLFGDAVTVLASSAAASDPVEDRARTLVQNAVLIADYSASTAEPWMHWAPCAGNTRLCRRSRRLRWPFVAGDGSADTAQVAAAPAVAADGRRALPCDAARGHSQSTRAGVPRLAARGSRQLCKPGAQQNRHRAVNLKHVAGHHLTIQFKNVLTKRPAGDGTT